MRSSSFIYSFIRVLFCSLLFTFYHFILSPFPISLVNLSVSHLIPREIQEGDISSIYLLFMQDCSEQLIKKYHYAKSYHLLIVMIPSAIWARVLLVKLLSLSPLPSISNFGNLENINHMHGKTDGDNYSVVRRKALNIHLMFHIFSLSYKQALRINRYLLCV